MATVDSWWAMTISVRLPRNRASASAMAAWFSASSAAVASSISRIGASLISARAIETVSYTHLTLPTN